MSVIEEEGSKMEKIVISLEEYKELLVIKGKYEELVKKGDKIIYVPLHVVPDISPYRYSVTTSIY